MTAPFRLRVRGRSGHASMPGVADNALLKAARLVTRLGEYRPEPRHTPETEALFAALGLDLPPAAETRSPPRSASTRSPARSSSRSCR